MFKAYSVSINNSFIENFNIQSPKKEEPDIKLSDFFNKDGTINGTDLINIWFPAAKYDVFLSHSHADLDLAYKFSSYLKTNFGLKTFIDSQVWNHMDKLLEILDKEFCYQKETNTYNYNIRNITTAHVHNMLSVALTKMMDSCECILFLNTKNSFIERIEKTPSSQTYSSWIYLEISNMSSLRIINRRKRIVESRQFYVHDSASIGLENFKVAYDTPQMSNLPILGEKELEKWKTLVNENTLFGVSSLDALYQCVPMNFDRK